MASVKRGEVRIDTSLIPKIEMDLLSRHIIERAEEFYADPKNLAAFEEWEKSLPKEEQEK